MKVHENEVSIDVSLVRRLVGEQFPDGRTCPSSPSR
jgi:hypothetical protein